MSQLPKDNLVENLRMLLNETGMSVVDLANRSKVSKRHLDYILAGDRKASIEIAEKLAAPFLLRGWHLIMPNLKYDIAKSGKLDQLISDFGRSEKATQDYISQVLDREKKAGNGH